MSSSKPNCVCTCSGHISREKPWVRKMWSHAGLLATCLLSLPMLREREREWAFFRFQGYLLFKYPWKDSPRCIEMPGPRRSLGSVLVVILPPSLPISSASLVLETRYWSLPQLPQKSWSPRAAVTSEVSYGYICLEEPGHIWNPYSREHRVWCLAGQSMFRKTHQRGFKVLN